MCSARRRLAARSLAAFLTIAGALLLPAAPARSTHSDFWTHATHRSIVIYADFRDAVAATPAIGHPLKDLLINTTANNYTNNVTDFFYDMSYRRLRVTLDFARNPVSRTGWFRLPLSVRAYGTGNPQSLILLTDAINAADREVDFSNYDSAIVVISGNADFDGDGTPDCPGFARGIRFGARPWKYNFSVQTKERLLTRAAGVCENQSLWVVAHEFGHVLGLPDMYDANAGGTARYMGGWDLMAGNSRFACATTTMRGLAGWSRLKLGFVRAEEVSVVNGGDSRTVSLDPLDARTLSKGSKRLIQFNNPLDPRKYLIVEVRRPKGYDAVAPGTGVIISQVDESFGDGEGTARIMPARGEAFTNPFDGALWKAPGEPAPASATCDTSPGTSIWSGRFSAEVQGVGLRSWFPTISVTVRRGDTYTVQVSGRVTR